MRARAGDRLAITLPPTHISEWRSYLPGRNEETEGHILEALRISPRDKRASGWMCYSPGQPNSTGIATKKRSNGRMGRSSSIRIRQCPRFCLAAVLALISIVSKKRAKLRAPAWNSTRASPSHDSGPQTSERQSRLSRGPRAHVQRPAQGRGTGRMTFPSTADESRQHQHEVPRLVSGRRHPLSPIRHRPDGVTLNREPNENGPAA